MTDKPIASGPSQDAGPLPQAKTQQAAKDATLAGSALTEFVSFHEGYVRHYITLADTKAAVLFGLASSFVAFLFSKVAFHEILFKPDCSWWTVLGWGSTLLLLAGTGIAASVIAPRLKSTGEGLIFFGAVRAFPNGEAYAAAVRDACGDKLTDARLRHCYDVSAVCWRKYNNLKRAIWFNVAGLALALPLLGEI